MRSRTCQCGCGRPARNKYATVACVPRQVRSAGGRKGRLAWAYRRRALSFRADLARLDRQVTREDLLDVLMRVYRRGYNTGFQQARQDASAAALERARERGAA